MQKRGFSLVELSIVIVIMMILSSYLAANYFTVSQARGEQEVRGRMDQINEAILNYAAAHKTGGRDLEVINNRGATRAVAGGADSLASSLRPPLSAVSGHYRRRLRRPRSADSECNHRRP